MSYEEKSGVCLIHKPVGFTSRAILEKARERLHLDPACKAGHAGTLDPQASGLLIVLTGMARKLQDFFSSHGKKYVATIFLGAFSATDDSEGPLYPQTNPHIPTEEELRCALDSWLGERLQTPPLYSAVRIKGKHAYQFARKGKKPILRNRKIHIHSIDLLDYDYPFLSLEIHCSAGTYIRAIARDLGHQLGCGGYLASLQRTACGDFTLAQALPVEQTEPSCLLSLEHIFASYPKLLLPESAWEKIRTGQKIEFPPDSCGEIQNPFFLWIENRLVALGSRQENTISSQTLLIKEF